MTRKVTVSLSNCKKLLFIFFLPRSKKHRSELSWRNKICRLKGQDIIPIILIKRGDIRSTHAILSFLRSTPSLFVYFPSFDIGVPLPIKFAAFNLNSYIYFVSRLHSKLVDFVPPNCQAYLFRVLALGFKDIIPFPPYTVSSVP